MCFHPHFVALPQGDGFLSHNTLTPCGPSPPGGQSKGPPFSMSTGSPHHSPRGQIKQPDPGCTKQSEEKGQVYSGPKENTHPQRTQEGTQPVFVFLKMFVESVSSTVL